MRRVVIAGAYMTPFGRFMDATLRSLATEATVGAIADAQAEISDVEAVYFGNAAGGLLVNQECVRGQVALRETGLLGRPVINVENACASSSTAFHLAWLAVAAGQHDVVLAIGAEKMSNADRRVPLRALEGAADAEELIELKKRIGAPLDEPTGSVFMDLYAHLARGYMHDAGATREDFAAVTVKSRQAAFANERAQFRTPTDERSVLAARMIADPLTLPMCSAIGDGAAALILTTAEFARSRGLPAIEVRASVVMSGMASDSTAAPVAQRAAARAYEVSGIGPRDLGVVELHDAAAPAELMLYEQLGLAEAGGGVALLRSGSTGIGGKLPVNPSGGLISKGHPIGATGCGQLVELANQLRGRCGARQAADPKVALAENGGGWLGHDAAAAVVTILSV
ncbi:MAG: thiolase family protein [Rhodospirillales bacterium]